MEQNKVYSLLGLAVRGRNAVSGGFATETAIKAGKAFLVIVAEDASNNTKKQFRNSCLFYEIPYFEFGDKDGLGHAMGKEQRSCLAVTDGGLAKSICKHLGIS